jgi:2-polyprenyl-3-methyl-5-hydroxy-6-metoxy-1,4-benzoquinol methylase
VAACCARGCDELFTEGVARRDADRYRRRGLDRTGRALRDAIVARGVEGATVLEIGGGVGALQLELLRAGAARSVNLELSPAYDEAARALAREAGIETRLVRRIHDVAADPAAVEPADVVVLHRVVCCYPDADALLRAAGSKATRALVFSYPRDAWWTRAAMRLENAWQRLRRRSFRAYVHDPDRMLATLEAGGLRLAWARPAFLGQAAAVARDG